MNLLDLFVKISCKDEASGQLDGIASGITGTMTKAAGVVSAVMGSAAVAGAAAIGKSALDAYASYEQLVGGVDTLFKDASGQLQQYAAEAYRTAGVSANRYMEITTSFSAALINSLGGDTAKAAEYANTALQDMSDNANKMGTDIALVQESYQSLARGNYEMLDNLKLGYGGTKAELERMLEDAERFMAANGEMRDLSVSNFSDIVDAIHAVQENMGITGTTALEAATTIEGSINMMKASWGNWLAGLGNEDADMSALTDQLVESVTAALNNVVPRIGVIGTTIGETLAAEAPVVAQELYSALLSVLPESIRGPIESAVSGAGEAIGGIGDAFSEYLGPALEVGNGLMNAAGEVISHLSEQAGTYLMPAIENLVSVFGEFVVALQPWIEPLTNVANLLGNIVVAAVIFFVDALTLVIGVVTTVMNAVMDFQAFLDTLPGTVGNVVNGVAQFFQWLPGIIVGILAGIVASIASWAASMGQSAIDAGSRFLEGVSAKFGEAVDWFASLPGKILGAIGDVGSLLWSAGSSIIDGLLSGLRSAWDGVVGWFGDITSQIPNLKGPLPVDAELLVTNGQTIIGGLLSGMEKEWKEVEDFLSSGTEFIGGSFDAKAVSPIQSGSDSVGRELVEEIKRLHRDLGGIIQRSAPSMSARDLRRATYYA